MLAALTLKTLFRYKAGLFMTHRLRIGSWLFIVLAAISGCSSQPSGSGKADGGAAAGGGKGEKRIILLTNGNSPFWDACRFGLQAGEKEFKLADSGLKAVMEVNDAVKAADVVMILLPDEQIGDVYRGIEPHIKKGASLAFAHGFNVHYNQVVPRADIDVWMVAPKAPGHTVRSTYTQGGGVPHLVAVHQDKSGKARDLAAIDPDALREDKDLRASSAARAADLCSLFNL